EHHSDEVRLNMGRHERCGILTLGKLGIGRPMRPCRREIHLQLPELHFLQALEFAWFRRQYEADTITCTPFTYMHRAGDLVIALCSDIRTLFRYSPASEPIPRRSRSSTVTP